MWNLFYLFFVVELSFSRRDKRLPNALGLGEDEVSFVASIQRVKDHQHLCTATLITFEYLLTSCSCMLHVPNSNFEFPYGSPGNYVAVAGADRLKNTTNMRKILKFYPDIECKYEREIWKNNIGFVLLQESFEKGRFLNVISSYLKTTISEYQQVFSLFANGKFTNKCFVYGWGKESDENYFKEDHNVYFKLKKKPVKYLNCEGHCRVGEPKSGVFCAGDGTDESFLADADQGSPLFCNENFIAVASFSSRCSNFFQKLKIKEINSLVGENQIEILSSGKKLIIPFSLYVLNILFLY